MLRKSFLSIISMAVITGCASQAKDKPFIYNDTVRGVPFGAVSMPNASNKTMRYITRQQVGQYLCEKQSSVHNEQRIISKTKPNIVFYNSVTGKLEMAIVPEGYENIIYDSKTPPFNMIACIDAMNSTTFSKLASLFINKMGLPLLQYGAGYLIADKLIDGLNEPRIQGENNRVITGDSNDYTEAGGIPIEGGINGTGLTIVPLEED